MSVSRLTQIAEQERESYTHYMAVISSDHAYVHKGLAFTGIINTGSISAAYDICFTTPSVASGLFLHWRPIGITSSANYVDIQFTEGETYTGGTAVTPINRNRHSSTTTTMQAFVKNATCTPSGTLISSSGIGSDGSRQARSGGGSGADQELLLKANTTYAITLTPAGATTCILELFWYEEPDGD